MATAMKPIDALNFGVAKATYAIVQVLPSFPAARLFADMVFGWPHAHSHPPNLIPPAPPIPLPSIGPVICAGAVSVLINGLPAARCGDVGFGVWCGGFFPLFEVQTGSSHVFIGGARPARMLIDFTKHCMPGTPGFNKLGVAMMAFSAGMSGLQIAASLTDMSQADAAAASAESAAEAAASSASATAAAVGAGVAAAQMVADLAAAALQAGMGKDPAIPPGIPMGNFLSGSPNVLIGGFPMPGWMAILRGLGKLLKKARARIASTKRVQAMAPGFIKCNILGAEPVNFVTGEVVLEHEDFSLPWRIPLAWTRRYGSQEGWSGVCGVGWQTPADARLEFEEGGTILFYDGGPGAAIFDKSPKDGPVLERVDGAILKQDGAELTVRTKDGLTYYFDQSSLISNEALVSKLTDQCGNSVTFMRDEQGLLEIRENSGIRIEVISRQGRIHEMILHHPLDRGPRKLVRYEYSSNSDLITVYDPQGDPYHFVYDNHCLIQHTDRNRLSFYYEYDKATPEGKCTHSWGDGNLYNYYFEHHKLLGQVKITNSLGQVTTLLLDDDGFPVQEIDALGGLTKYEYDKVGRTTVVIDPVGNRTEYKYDERGNLLKLTRPDGKAIQTQFNAADQVTQITDPNGAVWQQEWDPRGLLVHQLSPLGAKSRYEYDNRGQLIAFVNPLGARTRLDFDTVGNLTRLTDAMSHSTEFTYDVLGNVTTKTDPLGQRTRYDYDFKGRLTQAVLPSGASISCAYDPADNLTRYVDENGAVTHLEYFGQGEIKRRIQPDGYTVEYHYDTEERLIGVSNQRGERYELRRDPLGRIFEEIDYWGQSRSYAYTAAGHLSESVDPLGRSIRYQTDPLGRILSKLLPDPAGGEKPFEESFEYDANGNLTACANSHIRVERRFDAEGRLMEERQGDECVVTNTYDANGNRTARVTTRLINSQQHAHTVRYGYDRLGQAIQVETEGQAPIELTRNAIGQLTQERLSPGVRRQLDYSADGYLTAQRVLAAEGPVLDQEYRYDRAGNLIERRDSALGVDQYTYDPLGRLISHLDPQQRLKRYLNDPAGDRLRARVREPQQGKASSDWHRDGEYDGSYYHFDRAGNLTRRQGTDGNLQLTWDANQRLIESRTNGKPTTYQYDPLGRRICKQTGDTTTHFCWDGDALLGDAIVVEPGGAGPTVRMMREWVYYPGTFEPLALMQSHGSLVGSEAAPTELYLYHNDPNGCPTRLLDTKGKVVWAAHYTAWGGVDKVLTEQVENPLRLQGQYEDGETGLYFNRNRYYDPITGTYISADPLGLEAGVNPYLFARNTLGWIDPLGLSCKKPRSQFPIGRRLRFNTLKEAREAAEHASPFGRAVKHVDGPHGPHFHPADAAGKALNHDHYYFPHRFL